MPFNGLMVGNNLESVRATQSITVTVSGQSLKYSSSRPADLSHAFANADFAIFSRGVLEFRRFHCRVFGFAINRHQTSFSTSLSCTFLHLKTFNGSTAVALVASVHILCLQNSSALSCCNYVSRFCDRLWIDKVRPLLHFSVCWT